MNTFEINSETGSVKLNGKELECVNSIDLNVVAGDIAKLTINMDVKAEKVKLAVSGNVEWYKNDRKTKLRSE